MAREQQQLADTGASRVTEGGTVVTVQKATEEELAASAAKVPPAEAPVLPVEAPESDESAAELPDSYTEAAEEIEAAEGAPAGSPLGVIDPYQNISADAAIVPELHYVRQEGRRVTFIWSVIVVEGGENDKYGMFITEADYVPQLIEGSNARRAAGYWKVTAGPDCPFLQGQVAL
jgi:hypothetical protein